MRLRIFAEEVNKQFKNKKRFEKEDKSLPKVKNNIRYKKLMTSMLNGLANQKQYEVVINSRSYKDKNHSEELNPNIYG